MTRNRSVRLAAIACGAFGFALALSASAGIAQCDHCLRDYWLCEENQPDAQPSCLQQYFDCQTANGCEATFPPG